MIYVPTDNTVANNTEIVNNICTPAGVPIVAGEEGICKGCGVATLSISYYDLGVATGKMAVKVLQGEDISTMPIEYAPTFTKEYVASRCEAYGITVPDDYVALELSLIHISEPTRRTPISYAVFCLKKKKKKQ